MEIKWRNIIALVLVVFAVVLAVRVGPELVEALRSLGHQSYHRPGDDRVYRICFLGLLLVTLVVVVKLLVQRNRKG